MATEQENPTELLVWIYEDHQRMNIIEAPLGSGDMDSLEEGIHDLVESLFHWKEKSNQYFEIDLFHDDDEVEAGILKCLDAQTGKPRPFPTEWLKENAGKTHILNDPISMEPLLKLYSNPWRYRVEVIFTKRDSAPPPESSLDDEELQEKKEFQSKEEKLILSTLSVLMNLGFPIKDSRNAVKDALRDLVRGVQKLNADAV
jgi:hypothetical protein